MENFTKPYTQIETYTVSELLAPNPQHCRAMNTRMEALLRKHHADVFPAWAASMEAAGNGRDTNPHWGQLLAYIAAVLPITERTGWDWEDAEGVYPFSPASPEEARANRNRSLLVRLVLIGCKRRGEFLSPTEVEAQSEARLRWQEAAYRAKYGDAAYQAMIEGGEAPRTEDTHQKAA